MNCCNANCDCEQGEDCPVRAKICEDRMDKIEQRYVKWVSNAGLGMILILGSSAFVSSALVLLIFIAFNS